jgi:hypothetical protein
MVFHEHGFNTHNDKFHYDVLLKFNITVTYVEPFVLNCRGYALIIVITTKY